MLLGRRPLANPEMKRTNHNKVKRLLVVSDFGETREGKNPGTHARLKGNASRGPKGLVGVFFFSVHTKSGKLSAEDTNHKRAGTWTKRLTNKPSKD